MLLLAGQRRGPVPRLPAAWVAATAGMSRTAASKRAFPPTRRRATGSAVLGSRPSFTGRRWGWPCRDAATRVRTLPVHRPRTQRTIPTRGGRGRENGGPLGEPCWNRGRFTPTLAWFLLTCLGRRTLDACPCLAQRVAWRAGDALPRRDVSSVGCENMRPRSPKTSRPRRARKNTVVGADFIVTNIFHMETDLRTLRLLTPLSLLSLPEVLRQACESDARSRPRNLERFSSIDST